MRDNRGGKTAGTKNRQKNQHPDRTQLLGINHVDVSLYQANPDK